MIKLFVYVAGPYSKGDVVENVRKAIEVCNDLRSMGYVPFCPHLTHLWHMVIPHDIEYWYAYDFDWLKKCDVLYRIPGESHGADEEVRVAQSMGIPVVYSYSELASIEQVREDPTERANRLEAIVDRMSDKLAGCTLQVMPVRELCLQIENCGASEELTKASTMACDILHGLMDALEMKHLPPGAQ